MRTIVNFLALMILGGTPAVSKTWPSSGGFHVAETGDGCELSITYEGSGSTTLSIIFGFDGANYIVITNGLWTAEEGRIYDDVSFRFQANSFTGGTVLGVKRLYGSGFTAKASPNVLSSFARSPYLHISKSGEEIDRLSLKGSSKALQTAQACIRDLEARGQAESRRRQRFEDLPDDPFAKK